MNWRFSVSRTAKYRENPRNVKSSKARSFGERTHLIQLYSLQRCFRGWLSRAHTAESLENAAQLFRGRGKPWFIGDYYTIPSNWAFIHIFQPQQRRASLPGFKKGTADIRPQRNACFSDKICCMRIRDRNSCTFLQVLKKTHNLVLLCILIPFVKTQLSIFVLLPAVPHLNIRRLEFVIHQLFVYWYFPRSALHLIPFGMNWYSFLFSLTNIRRSNILFVVFSSNCIERTDSTQFLILAHQ